MWDRDRAELMRQLKRVLEHIHETGRLRPSDLQLPIRLSPFDTAISPLAGFESGEFDPERLGVACIVMQPTSGRGSNTKGNYRLSQVPTTPSLPGRPSALQHLFLVEHALVRA